MGSLAILAQEAGYRVTGSDQNVYPPMSTQLEEKGIVLTQGYDPVQLQPAPDLVVIGNAMSRGNPCVEYVLDKGLPYTSGPAWLHDFILPGRWVLAVAGTHGKTTTTAILAWILEQAGMSPGFLIGGVPGGFSASARLGETPFFVIEADEYDTAFFDKRSKFVHYAPRTLILNNLEYDHADIFPDLAAIQRQFQHLLRLVPSSGLVIRSAQDKALQEVVAAGCWSPQALSEADDDWQTQALCADGSHFQVWHQGVLQGEVRWHLTGRHNMQNAVHALIAARHVGVTPAIALDALSSFPGVKRRMELRGEVAGVRVYDDFAHHPTAIATTLAGVRARVGQGRVVAVIEPRSNTMRMGTHQAALMQSVVAADEVFWYQPEGMGWSLAALLDQSPVPARVLADLSELVAEVIASAEPGTEIVVMSNGSFGGIHEQLLKALKGAENV